MHFYFHQYFELLGLLAAAICYKGLRRFCLGIFLPMLILINIVETGGGNYLFLGLEKRGSYILYNILIVCQTPMYLLIFSRMMMLRKTEFPIFIVVSALAECF